MRLKWIGVLAMVAVGLFLIIQAINSPTEQLNTSLSSHPVSKEAQATDQGLPENYWDHPTATQGEAPSSWHLVEKNLNPESCAQCHREQFDAWKESLHAAAYSPGLIGQFPDFGHGESNECLVCHAPLAEQKYTNDAEMQQSLLTKLAHPKGFDTDAKLNVKKLPLRHAGVTCAACHVRDWQRFGPPQRGTNLVGKLDSDAHGGFTATKAFEKSQFCASCHQFPQEYAINGKPLENTVFEWQNSRFAKENIQCQTCHMPDRKHEFRGIHDVQMTRKGLTFDLRKEDAEASLSITSSWIGHAFPTYVTPKVIVSAQALDAKGDVLKDWQWDIIREVVFDNGWEEARDTRLMPGESRLFTVSDMPAASVNIRFRVNVIPDYFYKGVYRNLLLGGLDEVASKHMHQALKDADANDYLLYEKTLWFK